MTAHQTIKKYLTKVYISYRHSLFLLASILLVACSENVDKSQLSAVEVEFWYQQQVIDCQRTIEYQAIDWRLQHLALFVSDISISLNSQIQPVTLVNNDWQNSGTALLHLAAKDCSVLPTDNVISERHASITIPTTRLLFDKPLRLDETSQLSFTLGLPFAINHLDPLSQPAPINQPSMFWSWRGGHKFLRLDMQSDEHAWNFHLGSTGCSAASAMRSPQQECLHPNRLEFSLPRQENGYKLIVHLDKLLSGLELNTKSSCLMQTDNRSCGQLMNNLTNNGVFEWR